MDNNKYVGYDTKDAARRSPKCIRKTMSIYEVVRYKYEVGTVNVLWNVYLSYYRNSVKYCFHKFTEIGQSAAEL